MAYIVYPPECAANVQVMCEKMCLITIYKDKTKKTTDGLQASGKAMDSMDLMDLSSG
jgi:hypothetical protein